MPKEKNRNLNPYYYELLKHLVVYRFKQKIGTSLSIAEKEILAEELNTYNTPDSLNKIFSDGNKRRQNFNPSSLQGLCNYLGYDNWEDFVKKEYKYWAAEYDNRLYRELEHQAKDKIISTVIIRVLQNIEYEILKGIELYVRELGGLLNDKKEYTEEEWSKVWKKFLFCMDVICRKYNQGRIFVLYRVAENIESSKCMFDNLNLPVIFQNEFYGSLRLNISENAIVRLIKNIKNPISREILELYQKSYTDIEIQEYYNCLGLNYSIEEIQFLRWQATDIIYHQYKTRT